MEVSAHDHADAVDLGKTVHKARDHKIFLGLGVGQPVVGIFLILDGHGIADLIALRHCRVAVKQDLIAQHRRLTALDDVQFFALNTRMHDNGNIARLGTEVRVGHKCVIDLCGDAAAFELRIDVALGDIRSACAVGHLL